MALSPDFESFRAGFESGNNQIVWTRLPADLDTPVSAMLKLAGAQRHAFMLESVTGGEVRGRYSIIGMNPDLVWECRGTSSRVNRAARWDDDAWEDLPGHPLDALRALAFALVILYHVAMYYVADWHWHLKSPHAADLPHGVDLLGAGRDRSRMLRPVPDLRPLPSPFGNSRA